MGRRKKHLRAVKPVEQCAYSFFLNIYIYIYVCKCVCVCVPKAAKGISLPSTGKENLCKSDEAGAEFYTQFLSVLRESFKRNPGTL